MDLGKKLWCDLKTDEERAEFIRCGRAWETGIIAHSMTDDLIEIFEFRAKYKKIMARGGDIRELEL